MKILLFTESFPTLAHPGRAIFLQRQAEALARHHDVSVCFPQPWLPGIDSRRIEPRASEVDMGSGVAVVENCEVKVTRPHYLYIPRHRGIRIRTLASVLRRVLEREAFDIVHAHWISPAGAAAVRAGKVNRIPVVVTAHAGDVYRELHDRKLREIARRTLLDSDGVIAVACHFRDALESLGVPEGKVRFISNGVGNEFRPVADREGLRRQLGLPIGKTLFAYLGNLYPAKGPGTVLEAFAKVRSPSARLLIAGNGPMAKHLRDRAQELRISDRVLFRGWFSHDAMPDLLGAADFFVLASEAEGNPVTVLESLCCGTPVIGSDIAAIREVIKPGFNGKLAAPGSAAAFATAMTDAMSRDWDTSEIAQHAKAKYSWPVVAARIEACYADLTGDVVR